MESLNKKLERNEDGTLKIFDWQDLPSFAKTSYEAFKESQIKFILGTYSTGEQQHGWVLPIALRYVEDLSPDALESFVTQRFDLATSNSPSH